MGCRICGEMSGTRHQAREMMFGLGDAFTYFECAACGCLQLEDPPPDLQRYYPAGYYSFAEPSVPQARGGSWRAWAEQRRTRAQLFGGGGPWRLLAHVKPRLDLACLRHAGLRDGHARILDVGCGSGLFLRKLAGLGFRDLVGIDPFLESDRDLGPGLRLLAMPLEKFLEVDRGRFDLVMFHHALEHMPDPLAALRITAQLLRPGGTCLIRIPVASCEAWRLYRMHWVELDAPRHFFLPTRRGIQCLALRAGLEMGRAESECLSMAYWGSELYRRGLTLFDHDSGGMRSPRTVFSLPEMQAFEAQAARAIRKGRGGPGVFYLRRA